MFFNEIASVFENSRALCFVLSFGIIALLIAVVISCFCKNERLYYALSCIIAGCIGLAVFATKIPKPGREFCWSVLALCAGIGYGSLLLVFYLEQRKEERKKKRAQILRKLQFTLPDKDNTYVRSRLNSVLRTVSKPKEMDSQKPSFELECDNKDELLRLEHVRKLLLRIKEAPLTKAERLETEEMASMFSAYLHKNKWTPSDVRVMNDLFSALLKIAAKYAV